MKTLKKSLMILLFAVSSTLALAQNSSMPLRLQIVNVDVGIDGKERLEVFNMPQDGVNHFFLSVGHLGIGDEVFQILFDPVFELFIPLGDTVAEALETMNSLQSLFKEEPGTSIDIPACFAFRFPNDERETAKVTYHKLLLSRQLHFSLQREDSIRATYVNKSDLKALENGLKIYGKIYPDR